ncbi:hypothetical protein EWZ97_04655, partial [Helicobacter pylori]|nr:hypothetical protein [Helicobacter pylori]NHA59911.1 hypothetical protein [Helicobacter pylori]
MLKLVSRTICLSLIGLFNPLEAFQKHQKDGFFVEAGFETGLLEGVQTKEEVITTQKIYENPLTHPQTKEQPKEQNKSDTATPQSAYGKYYIPQSTILEKATELFTTANIDGNGLTFYSQNPVYANMVNGSVTIQNFLPYNLNNVELSFKDAQGKVVNLGVIETIPKDSQIILPASLFNDSEFEQADSFNYQQLQATATQFSDANTQSLFEKLSQITTNVTMSYENADTNNFKGNCHDCVSDFTPQTAEELTNLML